MKMIKENNLGGKEMDGGNAAVALTREIQKLQEIIKKV